MGTVVAACSVANTDSYASGSYQTISLTSEDYDPAGMHDAGSPSRVTVPSGLSGYYLMLGLTECRVATTGYRGVRFSLDGSTTSSQIEFRGSTAYIDAGVASWDVQQLNGGQYIELQALQTSGSSRSMSSRLTLARLSTQQLCVASFSGTTSLSNDTLTAVSLTEQIDTDGWHSDSTNPSRVTVSETGRYLICGQAQFDPNATGVRVLDIYRNFASILPAEQALTAWGGFTGSTNNGHITFTMVDLDAGDVIELFVKQTSGGSLDLLGGKLAVIQIASSAVAGYVTGSPGSQSIDADSWEAMDLDSEQIDTDGWHSNSTNPSRMTCQTDGTYLTLTKVGMGNANTGSVVGAGARVNGSESGGAPFTLHPGFTGENVMPVHMNVHALTAGDYLELYAYNGVGGARLANPQRSAICWLRLDDISTATSFTPQIYRRL